MSRPSPGSQLSRLGNCPSAHRQWGGARGGGGSRGTCCHRREDGSSFPAKRWCFGIPFKHKVALQDAEKQEPNSQTQHGAGGKHAAAFQGIAERIPLPSVKKTGCRPHSCSHRQGSPHKHIFSVSTKPWLYTTLLLIRL